MVAGPGIGSACVRVADVGGEEFDRAPGGFLAEIGDQRRHDVRRRWSAVMPAWVMVAGSWVSGDGKTGPLP